MANQSNVVLTLTSHELLVLDAIFTFESEDDEDDTWKQDLSDKGLNALEDEEMDVTDAEDLVDQLAVKIRHLAALASQA